MLLVSRINKLWTHLTLRKKKRKNVRQEGEKKRLAAAQWLPRSERASLRAREPSTADGHGRTDRTRSLSSGLLALLHPSQNRGASEAS